LAFVSGRFGLKAGRLSAGARALALEIAAEARPSGGSRPRSSRAAFVRTASWRAGIGGESPRRFTPSFGWIRRLDAILEELVGRELRELGPVARDELKLLALEAREGLPVEAVQGEVTRLVRREVDFSGVVDEDAGLGKRTGIERDAVRLSYPTWMIETFTNDLGREAGLALAAHMNTRAPMALRVNAARITREALAARLAEEHVIAKPTPLAPAGLVLETRVNAFGLSAFQEGLFEVMDEGSQVVAELVAPPPGGGSSTRARARAASRSRSARSWTARAACSRSTPMARSSRSCAAARAARASRT